MPETGIVQDEDINRISGERAGGTEFALSARVSISDRLNSPLATKSAKVEEESACKFRIPGRISLK
jgi:hypothetical protein